jgi:hypothetical protein
MTGPHKREVHEVHIDDANWRTAAVVERDMRSPKSTRCSGVRWPDRWPDSIGWHPTQSPDASTGTRNPTLTRSIVTSVLTPLTLAFL